MSDETPGAPQPEKKYRKTPPATPAVQAWLDGDQSRDELGTADEQETAELWARINNEAASLRTRHTPIHVQSRIMSSLPDVPVVNEPLAEPAKKMNPATTVIAAIVILAIGGLIGFMLVR
ncbi:MAG TPA: transmembrane domain-containing protein [Gemmatimonadaceae bacterium]